MKARHRLAALFSWTDRNADGLAGAFTNRSADKDWGTRMSWLRLPLALVLASALSLGLAAAPAFAKETHVLTPPSIGEPGTGNGQLALGEHSGVALNEETGAIYVADTGNGRVEQFESSGAFARTFGSLTTPTFIAVDNSAGGEGDVYVADSGTSRVYKFEADGAPVTAWGESGSIDGSSAPGGPFGELAGIAVDSSGNLWVYNTSSEMFEFAPGGSFEQEWNSGRGVTPAGIAVDPTGDLYVATGLPGITKFTSSGTEISDIYDGFLGITGLVIDPSTGDLYVDNEGEVIDQFVFNGSGEVIEPDGSTCVPAPFEGCSSPTETFGSSEPEGGELAAAQGLAVGAAQTVYAANGGASQVDAFKAATLADVTTGQASNVQPTSATLNGTVNPDSTTITDCHFAYVANADYQPGAPDPYSAGATIPCSSTPSGNSPTPVSADISGLAPHTAYHFQLLATNSDGTGKGQDQTFFTPGPPAIDAESVANVTDTNATLKAQINPERAATSYHFEYGTADCASSVCTSVPAADAAIGSGSSDVAVAEAVFGLTPDTTYHFRVVATNPSGTTDGPDQTFTTYPAAISGLPDGRAYEQVTAIDKNGHNPAGGVGAVQASIAGDRITFLGPSGLPGGVGESDTNPSYLASRSSGGWSIQGLQVPLTTQGYPAGWSPDLSQVALTGNDPSCPQGGGNCLYLHSTANAANHLILQGDARVAAFTPDGSHLLFESMSQLLPSATPGVTNLYEYDNGQLSLVGLLPASAGAAAPPGGSFAGPYNWVDGNTSAGGTSGPGGSYYLQNTISTDGARVFFTAGGTGQLYVRENGDTTVQVSASQRTVPDPNGPQPAAFIAATPDGSHVFFTSCEKLTNDSTAASPSPGSGCFDDSGLGEAAVAGAGSDLYSYDVGSGTLTDLTVDGNVSDAVGADVQGVLGASADGSYVYFAANGVLAANVGTQGSHASPGNCQGFSTPSGDCNLYLWHDGTITFVASLDNNATQAGGADSLNWQPSPFQSPYGNGHTEDKIARVASDGKTLLFGSIQQQTSYDNAGSREFYRYDATSEALVCVSCSPTGSPPAGGASLRSIKPPYFTGELPMPFLTRNLSADGSRVFFETPDALVPQDTNGQQDVYEWEANATGSCQRPAGCLFLLSTGTSAAPSFFADASASGDDAFLFTTQSLVAQDQDQIRDLYDARVDGGIASQNPPNLIPCSGDNCKPPPAGSPSEQIAGSGSFTGPGNPPGKRTHCNKSHKLVNGKCVKKHRGRKHHRHHHHHRAARPANRNRGGSR